MLKVQTISGIFAVFLISCAIFFTIVTRYNMMLSEVHGPDVLEIELDPNKQLEESVIEKVQLKTPEVKHLKGIIIDEAQLLLPKVLFVVPYLKSNFTHAYRKDNVARMVKVIPNLYSFPASHGHDNRSRNDLMLRAADLKLFVAPSYYSGGGHPLFLGKIGIYVTFLQIFHSVLALKHDQQEPNLLQIDRNKYRFNKLNCLVVIEDDFKLLKNDLRRVKYACRMLIRHEKNILFYRLGPYNSINAYKISGLRTIIRSIETKGITDPFDIMTTNMKWFKKGVYLKRTRSHRVKGPSTLTSQQKVTIDSWNECINSIIEERELLGHEINISSDDRLICDLDLS